MKKMLLCLAVLCMLLCTGQLSALTVNFDADLSEWVGVDVVDLGSRADPDGGSYTFLATWDVDNLYLGMERGSSTRYLGDTGWDNDSFFVAIDVDGIAGSGATTDGYSRVSFSGTYLPDYFLYYAGGPNWYESSSWNSATSSMDWLGWTDSGAIYGDDDEFAVDLSLVGAGDDEFMVWAWMTREANGWVEAAWGFDSGDQPTAGDGIMVIIPEPITMLLFSIGSLAVIRCKK